MYTCSCDISAPKLYGQLLELISANDNAIYFACVEVTILTMYNVNFPNLVRLEKIVFRVQTCIHCYKHANHMTMTTSGQIMHAMVWLPQDKRKRENKIVRLVWDFDYLHFAQYILISPHGIDCKQTWCKKIYHMDRVSWLKHLCYTLGHFVPSQSWLTWLGYASHLWLQNGQSGNMAVIQNMSYVKYLHSIWSIDTYLLNIKFQYVWHRAYDIARAGGHQCRKWDAELFNLKIVTKNGFNKIWG